MVFSATSGESFFGSNGFEHQTKENLKWRKFNMTWDEWSCILKREREKLQARTIHCRYAGTNHGGIRPSASTLQLCFLQICSASFTGFFTPRTAPTAPKCRVLPSMTLASHSTCPSHVKLEPNPAFVRGESSNTAVASVTTSRAVAPEAKSEYPYVTGNIQ
jgi:hypothetical protein